jgi:hypothetical protein
MNGTTILVLLSTVSTFAWAAPEAAKTKPAAPVAAKSTAQVILAHSLKLDDYLKNLDPKWIVERMDTAGKGKPDIWVIFEKNEDGSRRLVRQLFDLNRDNKVDLAKFYEGGKLARTEADLDYDGYVDVVSDYDVKTGELKKKTQADGLTSVWKYYFKNELRKKELDRNSDGKLDMWVYYRNGKILRTEIDQNFDGRVVRVEGPINPNKAKKTSANKAASSISE